MRVRPFFWFLLAFSCAGVLIFAALLHTQGPAMMQVHIDQQRPVANAFTTLELHLTISEGLPIEQAQVLPNAKMTNMSMVTNQIHVESWARYLPGSTSIRHGWPMGDKYRGSCGWFRTHSEELVCAS